MSQNDFHASRPSGKFEISTFANLDIMSWGFKSIFCVVSRSNARLANGTLLCENTSGPDSRILIPAVIMKKEHRDRYNALHSCTNRRRSPHLGRGACRVRPPAGLRRPYAPLSLGVQPGSQEGVRGLSCTVGPGLRRCDP